MEAWREELYHYAKGSTAKGHKYIRKEGNRYIYAEDLKGRNGKVTMLPSGSGPLTSNNPPSPSQIHGFNIGYTTQDAVLGANANGKDGYKLPADMQQKVNTYVLNYAKDATRKDIEEAYKKLENLNGKQIRALGLDGESGVPEWGLEEDKLSYEQKVTIMKMLRIALYKYLYKGKEELSQSDSVSPELYHTAIGGTLIITRR